MRALPATLLVLLLPLADATWYSHGQAEPDTPHDDGWMWTAPPQGAHAHVYLQAYPTLPGSSANPNSGILGTRQVVAPLVQWEALLGVWTDCNGDGAIGLLEGAHESYPAHLLLDTRHCPVGTAHNDGWTVRELLPIGRGPGAAYEDADARIWGDAGRPGAAGFEACRVYPLPRGTTSNTGRTLRVLDCAAQHRLIGAINTIDNDGRLKLAIEDPHNPERSSSRLVVNAPVSLFGNPMDGRRGLLEKGDDAPPTAEAWDCDGDTARVHLAPTPTSSSLWEAGERAADAHAGDCDSSNGSPLGPYHVTLEQPFEPTSHSARDQNDLVFRFERTRAPSLTLQPWQTVRADADAPEATSDEWRWRAHTAFAGAPPLIARDQLTFADATYWTVYATLGWTARSFPLPGGSGIYGAEACGAIDTGIRRGWACDPAHWWTDPAGDTMPTDAHGQPWGARVGDRYLLRDVDCEHGPLTEYSFHTCHG